MAGALRKTMVYLGLADGDEHYEPKEAMRAPASGGDPLAYEHPGEGADYGTFQAAPAAGEYRAPVTPLKRTDTAPEETATDFQKITTIHPRSYEDAMPIGNSLRAGIPVIMNLTDMDGAESTRLVDFASGLAYGRHGSIERVASHVFLILPPSIEVLTEGKQGRRSESGFFNQS